MKASLTLGDWLAEADDAGWASPEEAKAAREKVLELGLDGDSENWRYTRQDGWLKETFQRETPAQGFLPEDLQMLTPEGVEMYRLVLVNGRVNWELSNLEGLPEGMGVGSLAGMRQYAEQEGGPAADMLSRLDTLSDPSNRSFTALNRGLAGEGVGLYVPEGVVVEKPLHVLHLIAGHEGLGLCQPRLLVVAEKNSSVTLFESHGGRDELNYFANEVSEFHVEQDASVEHLRVQRDSRQATRVSGLFARLAERAGFRSHTYTFSGKRVRNECRIELAGSNSHGEVNGLSLLNGESHVDNHIWIEHQEPDCSSRQMFKSVLDDKSMAVFSGRIHVAQKAQRTDAEQSGDALLLSDHSRSVARPQLEIYADDVKCTHGSTVGNLDETGLFYMRSRGIPADLARRVLMHAFAQDLLGRIRTETLAAPLDRLITRSLAED